MPARRRYAVATFPRTAQPLPAFEPNSAAARDDASGYGPAVSEMAFAEDSVPASTQTSSSGTWRCTPQRKPSP